MGKTEVELTKVVGYNPS